MTGKSRLPAGEPRKASQRRTRRAAAGVTRIMPQWRIGDRVRWQDKIGHFHRDLGDGNAEVTIANRAYRVRIGDLRPGRSRQHKCRVIYPALGVFVAGSLLIH